MIEKHIHYCWFGRGEKPQIVKECMATWKEKCPDYLITEWNEDNFDINFCQYTKDAYAAKKYAFVSDVARLWVIYHYGGTYLDTDVKLRGSLDELSQLHTWFAAETSINVNTGLGFGSEKHNYLVKKMLDDYLDKPFSLEPCPSINTRIIKRECPITMFDKRQTYNNITFLAFSEYGKYAEHLYANSWNQHTNAESNRPPSNLYRIYKWRIHVFWQTNRFMKWCLKNENSPLSKAYMFFVFDIWPNGFFNTVLPIIKRKIKRKK